MAATQGTLIVASNLFSNIPVRRSYAQKGGRPREELKKVENIVASFALICHHIRISLYHNNKQIFVKSKASTFDQSVTMTFGQSCLKSLHCLTEPEFTAYFPRKATSTQGDGVLGGSKADRKLFVFVNSRPGMATSVTFSACFFPLVCHATFYSWTFLRVTTFFRCRNVLWLFWRLRVPYTDRDLALYVTSGTKEEKLHLAWFRDTVSYGFVKIQLGKSRSL